MAANVGKCGNETSFAYAWTPFEHDRLGKLTCSDDAHDVITGSRSFEAEVLGRRLLGTCRNGEDTEPNAG